jgi:hypothetical protein
VCFLAASPARRVVELETQRAMFDPVRAAESILRAAG